MVKEYVEYNRLYEYSMIIAIIKLVFMLYMLCDILNNNCYPPRVQY